MHRSRVADWRIGRFVLWALGVFSGSSSCAILDVVLVGVVGSPSRLAGEL
jgi:hypothetical protein